MPEMNLGHLSMLLRAGTSTSCYNHAAAAAAAELADAITDLVEATTSTGDPLGDADTAEKEAAR
jgi:hypothetical protein